MLLTSQSNFMRFLGASSGPPPHLFQVFLLQVGGTTIIPSISTLRVML